VIGEVEADDRIGGELGSGDAGQVCHDERVGAALEQPDASGQRSRRQLTGAAGKCLKSEACQFPVRRGVENLVVGELGHERIADGPGVTGEQRPG
jgi:hypothetical protein